MTEKSTPKPWKEKKDYQAILRRYISIGEDGEEHYDVIDMQVEAQREVRWITDHQDIVKQYQNMVRAYNNFMQDYPWESIGGLMKGNCWFGDILKDEKRKVNLSMNWVELWVSMQSHYPWETSS